ncbi:MAG: hypothetical protein II852_02210 [Bacteroidales bacterium]|nr:hypothetical protein [Bacteroidales bacterium]
MLICPCEHNPLFRRFAGDHINAVFEGIVDSYADFDVKVITDHHIPDIEVKLVDQYPGFLEFKEVDSYPDFTIRIVKEFADIEVKVVKEYPSIRRF